MERKITETGESFDRMSLSIDVQGENNLSSIR